MMQDVALAKMYRQNWPVCCMIAAEYIRAGVSLFEPRGSPAGGLNYLLLGDWSVLTLPLDSILQLE